MAWSGSEFEESMPNTRTQTTSRNLLLQAYICAAELATWGVGPDVIEARIAALDMDGRFTRKGTTHVHVHAIHKVASVFQRYVFVQIGKWQQKSTIQTLLVLCIHSGAKVYIPYT